LAIGYRLSAIGYRLMIMERDPITPSPWARMISENTGALP
jgi:hypothetical protein